MKSRLIASLVVGAALVLGTSGCSLISAHATTIEYSLAEGTNVPDESGPLQVRNTMIVANDEGTEGNFLAAIINSTDETYVLNIDFADGVTEQVIVPAGTVKSLGESGGHDHGCAPAVNGRDQHRKHLRRHASPSVPPALRDVSVEGAIHAPERVFRHVHREGNAICAHHGQHLSI